MNRSHENSAQLAVKVTAGVVLAAALAVWVWGGAAKPRVTRVGEVSALAAPAALPRPPVIAAAIATVATPPPLSLQLTPPMDASGTATTPTFETAPTCEGVRLVDISGQGRDTTVWLGDAHGIEQVELGQPLGEFVLLEVQPESEQGPALALLRGPHGTCRTPRKREALDAMHLRLESAPPSTPSTPSTPSEGAATKFTLTPALATELVAALNLKPASPSGE